MDPYHDVFRWHERFAPVWIDPGRLLLLSEGDALLLETPAVIGLALAFERRESLAALCRREPWSARLAILLHALEMLVDQGHVVLDAPPGPVSRAIRHACPDFSAEPPRPAAACERVDVLRLARAVDEPAALAWARALDAAVARPLTVVFCDDLLDPRLEAVDRRARADGRAWLPVKATGNPVTLGPLFEPPRGACWHCLAHRLLRNQPVRHAWRAQGRAWPGVPVRCDADAVARALATLRLLAPALVAAGPQRLLAVDESATVREHVVATRPQCPACGEPGLLAQRQLRRPVLGAAPATRAPAATIARLEPLVSPLCGVISHLAAVDPQRDDGRPTIWRSGFFKTPAPGPEPLVGGLAQICLGKGASDAQARAGALCEAVERYAAYHQGDEARVDAAARALDAPAVLPQRLAPGASRACSSDETMGWAPAWSLTQGARRYLPFGFCYAHAPAEDAARIGWTSNGCAAGETLSDAVLHGLLEAIERDAAAAWWYNRVPRPAIELEAVAAAGLRALDRVLGAAWERWALEITHDLGVPVVAAVGRHRASGDWALGFGCAPTLARACEGALGELAQLVSVDKRVHVPAGDADEPAPRFLLPDARAPSARRREPAGLGDCVRAAWSCGLETLVLDYSRPDLPLHTAKVVLPGASHIWPAWTTPRMREVPVKLGWLDWPLADHELNPQPLFV